MRYLVTLILFLFIPLTLHAGIIDNGDNGTTATGSWSVSSVSNYYGDDSLFNDVADTSYSFQVAVSGIQEISLWWTEWTTRSASVPVEIYDGDTLLDTVLVNQTAQGGQWNVLGTYNFTETAKIIIIAESSRSTCADAVRFNPVDTTETIVDNNGTGTSFTGSWNISGGADPYGAESLYSNSAGDTYIFSIPANESQEISLWWTEWPSRSSSVPVEIYNGDILLNTVEVNQAINGGKWNILGNYTFSGTAEIVIVSEGNSQSTCADAVRFKKISTDAGRATLTWDPPVDTPDIAGYQVYYGHISLSAEGFEEYEFSQYADNVTSFVVQNLIRDDTYYFAVTTKDVAGNESVYSNEVYCTIGENDSVPLPPINLTVVPFD